MQWLTSMCWRSQCLRNIRGHTNVYASVCNNVVYQNYNYVLQHIFAFIWRTQDAEPDWLPALPQPLPPAQSPRVD